MGRTMKLRMFLALAVLTASCSARQPKEQQTPQCLSLCANQFASCTQEFPGDAAACQPSRNECERTCAGERAVQRMEGDENQVFVPIDAPDAGGSTPTPSPDGGI